MLKFRCPKCRSGWVEARWCDGSGYIDCSEEKEHSHCRCESCKYVWTKPAEETENENENLE